MNKTKITTKRGDEGMTDCGRERMDKDTLLVEVIGQIDELQAVMESIDGDGKVIQDLGLIMGELGFDSGIKKLDSRIEQMEGEIEKEDININKFVIFKTKESRGLNWARTVCRRVERRVVSLNKKQKIDKNILKYFNRLSDYLFILAIKEN